MRPAIAERLDNPVLDILWRVVVLGSKFTLDTVLKTYSQRYYSARESQFQCYQLTMKHQRTYRRETCCAQRSKSRVNRIFVSGFQN